MHKRLQDPKTLLHSYTPALKAFLGFSLKKCMMVLNAECGSFFLFDPNNNELILNSYYNRNNLVKNIRKRIGEGICGAVADRRTPVLVKDIKKDQRFKQNGFSHYRTNSFISVPLFNSYGLVGVINITDKKSKGSFNTNDLDLLVLIADFISLILEDNISYKSVANANKLLQDSLKNALEEKEELDKKSQVLEKFASVGKLAAGIVHEINNPLDGMIRYNNLLLKKEQDNIATREYLLEIKSGLSRLMNITRSLLEFSQQLNSNTQYKVDEYIEIHGILDEILSSLFSQANNIRIIRDYGKDLLALPDKGIVYVFSNIIKNAFDAMEDGGTLEIKTADLGNAIFISFRDTGCGISEDIKDKIFDPFFTTKKMGQGAGLGLSICYQIVVEKYKGRITVESSPNKGSKFIIYLPKDGNR